MKVKQTDRLIRCTTASSHFVTLSTTVTEDVIIKNK